MKKNREEEHEEARLAKHISTPLPIILRCNAALIAGLLGEMKVLELLETDPRVFFLSVCAPPLSSQQVRTQERG